jgi:hypothetical protein
LFALTAGNEECGNENVRVEDRFHQRSSKTIRSTSFSVNRPLARAFFAIFR